jgi:two-component system, NtrC family, sensor kinase
MKIRLSISVKLLLFTIPLVSLPIALVGYFSYQTALGIVTRMSQEEQMLLVKGAADKIDTIFHSCKLDLEMISRIPFVGDYYLARIKGQVQEAEVNRKHLTQLFTYLLDRSPFYFQIRFFSREGTEMIRVLKDPRTASHRLNRDDGFYPEYKKFSKAPLFISDISFSSTRQGYVVYFAKPLAPSDHGIGGTVVIDLDYDEMIKMVKEIRVGDKGYAFMVDHLGRTIAHPEFAPYEMDLKNYPNPQLREFIIDMIAGEIGWKTYFYMGEKIAAYTPIPTMEWSLAVSIPIEEFKREVQNLQKRIFEVVLIALIVTVGAVIVLSYNLIRPVRRLVLATERIAGGDLEQEISVKSRDELGTLTQSFNRMVHNLKETQDELVRSEKFVSLGRLSAGVAHEIRNPLNAMKGAIVHLQRRRPEDPLLSEYTQLILEEMERLNSFVTDFLYLAKESVPKLISTNLNELILNTLTFFEEPLAAKGIQLSKDLGNSLPPVKIDPHQMEQVLINLLINARDAMPGGGSLEIATRFERNEPPGERPDKILITIKDTGMGIPAEHQANIFDPFFSLKKGGTGLGLPISLGIVESHGGKMAIQSTEGAGTVVTIELPTGNKESGEESKSA